MSSSLIKRLMPFRAFSQYWSAYNVNDVCAILNYDNVMKYFFAGTSKQNSLDESTRFSSLAEAGARFLALVEEHKLVPYHEVKEVLDARREAKYQANLARHSIEIEGVPVFYGGVGSGTVDDPYGEPDSEPEADYMWHECINRAGTVDRCRNTVKHSYGPYSPSAAGTTGWCPACGAEYARKHNTTEIRVIRFPAEGEYEAELEESELRALEEEFCD